MIEHFEKIFLDTAPLVYYLDIDERYAWKVKNFFSWALDNGKSMCTSVITATEYLTHPYRNGNLGKIASFFAFIADSQIEMLNVDIAVAEKAARIRAEYPYFKTMDSLQLAAALSCNCDAFLTNDRQLCQFTELNCIMVDSL